MNLYKVNYSSSTYSSTAYPSITYIEASNKMEVVEIFRKKFSLYYNISSISFIESDSIKKSDKTRTFESGAIRGNADDKENYIGAVSWIALKRITKYQNEAEKKGGYSKGHWKKGIPIEEFEKSLMRHLQKYLANKYENANEEPEVDHLAAAFFNLQGIIFEEEKEKI